MKAEIIAVGNEIITGNTINTNAAYIAKAMLQVGIRVCYHSAVGDYAKDIHNALKIALERVDVVIFIGGLGPTEDDLTKETVSAFCNKELILDQETSKKIEEHFSKRKMEMPTSNYKQALFPEKAYILKNDNGTAPGCTFMYDDKYIVLLPGPPKELIPMIEHRLIPYFKNISKDHYYTIDTKLWGIGESLAAKKLAHVLGEYENYSVAPYVNNTELIIRTIAHSEDINEAIELAEKIKGEITSCLNEYVIGYNDKSIEDSILELLDKHQYTIATVESCTGGMLASSLVNCSGISKYFSEGIITYSNEAKMKYVKVSKETLDKYGAVSEQTAKEMAEGIKEVTRSHIGLSTTGIAGPTGATKDKPVGLVYIGIALPDKTHVFELHLTGSRENIRQATVRNILYRLYTLLR